MGQLRIGSSLIQNECRWAELIATALSKGVATTIQWAEDSFKYVVYFVDGITVHVCEIFKGPVPGGGDASYTQTDNDNAKTAFEATYKSATNLKQPLRVQLDFNPNMTPQGVASTGTPSVVSANVSAVTLLAANAARKGATIYNRSNKSLYVMLANSTPSSTSHTVMVQAGAYFEIPYGYTGIVKGIWAPTSPSNDAQIVEYT